MAAVSHHTTACDSPQPLDDPAVPARAGLIDEHLAIAPILLAPFERLFDDLDGARTLAARPLTAGDFTGPNAASRRDQRPSTPPARHGDW